MQNDMRDRLIEIIGDKPFSTEYERCDSFEWAEHFADHLIANGVVLLPCNVNDTVYYLDGSIIVESKVHCISFGGRYGEYSKGQIHIYDSDKDNITVKIEQFGTRFFLTKDQAEQKLKELSEQDA